MFHDSPEGSTHSWNDGCGDPSHNAYAKLTELSDMLENRTMPQEEVLRIIDEVRAMMRVPDNGWMGSEHRKKLIEAADRCKPIFDREMKTD